MAKTDQFQRVTGYINLSGNRSSTTFRGTDDPMTYPETLVLQAVHGGEEHVHTLVEHDYVETTQEDEYDRLLRRYGAVVRDAFPMVGGSPSLPTEDDNIPTPDQVAAAQDAAKEAMAKKGKSRSRKKSEDPNDADTAAAADTKSKS